jgi:hypothetical protein
MSSVYTVTPAKAGVRAPGSRRDLRRLDSGQRTKLVRFRRNDAQGFHITVRELKLTALGDTNPHAKKKMERRIVLCNMDEV